MHRFDNFFCKQLHPLYPLLQYVCISTLKSENIAKLFNLWPRKKCLTYLEIARETGLNDHIEMVLCSFLSITKICQICANFLSLFDVECFDSLKSNNNLFLKLNNATIHNALPTLRTNYNNRLGIGLTFDPLLTSQNNKKRWCRCHHDWLSRGADFLANSDYWFMIVFVVAWVRILNAAIKWISNL